MTQTITYEERLRGFEWSVAERELGHRAGNPINIGWMCSDRICRMGHGARRALVWEGSQGNGRTYSFDDLRVLSNTLADYLKTLGVRPGERVCLFLDRVPELYFAFLGILKLGAVVQPLFSAFGDESLFTRLKDAGACAVFTQRRHLAKVRKVRSALPELRHVIVVDAGDAPLQPGELGLTLDRMPRCQDFPVHPTTSESPSLLHYTSGTTGQPKGAQHVHGSVISQYLTAKWVLDLREGDVYWCNADPGWVTGTSYGIIGPWANGVTQVVLDSGFQAGRWYDFLARHKVTVWYSAPTAIRLLMKEGKELPRRFDLSSLRHLASVGEPLNAEAVIWSRETFGIPFLDTCWLT
ncbi:MAG: AMP-binding protein [Candidatus Eisenbacteria bacterium]|nr:AMP-binding protein [Candidatus Eisenbacteria bacterium]